MREIELKNDRGLSRIFLGGSIEELPRLVDVEKTVVITDTNVDRLYGEKISDFRRIVIEPGEINKSLDTVKGIYEELMDFEADRSTKIVGIGGGVVCDIAGFVASTYLRGLFFAFVPTTLLAQVDAAVGGKNGVNFFGYKNLIGTINQPDFVLCDFNLLKTLTPGELKNGFAEAIKHGLIGDYDLLSFMEKERTSIISLKEYGIERIVHDSLKLKTSIVAEDEREGGKRRILNFGHTIGHALEKTLQISHGEAVSLGMAFEAYLSEIKGYIEREDVERIYGILKGYGLPVHFDGKADTIIDAIRKDKKREGDYIYAILLHRLGEASIERIKLNEIEGLINDMCKFE
ncbi:MAG: 3-dehydroquinate synthase [Syntrophorhabdaceae bacterium]|nr:3-dehydroquinate synthase [Syntrophorhabdaceae bacterium]